nr:hypothetical protein Itr_chr03CG26650 [Ipomoea trifida]
MAIFDQLSKSAVSWPFDPVLSSLKESAHRYPHSLRSL